MSIGADIISYSLAKGKIIVTGYRQRRGSLASSLHPCQSRQIKETNAILGHGLITVQHPGDNSRCISELLSYNNHGFKGNLINNMSRGSH